MRWVEHIACMEEMRSAYRILVGKAEGKRLLGRPRSAWEDNIRMDLREKGGRVCNGCIWLRLGTSG